jgi:hypothetical protein
MIAYAFLQHRRFTKGGGQKKRATTPTNLPAARPAIVDLIVRPSPMDRQKTAA